ncbi:MAG: thiamine phosphate synthase [Planctomycetota bacterium]|nr:thiamine phosphate synthase [Planctomycetota bacterium]
MAPDALEIRDRLARARIVLLFTPELAGAADPLAVLEAAAAWIDVVQIRPKPLGGGAAAAPCPGRATFDWAERVLALGAIARAGVLVTVDDRVDVAVALWPRGLAGVHVGQDDMPANAARRLLGPGPLLGLSTHDLEQVLEADEAPVDYLGFGPVNSTRTKGYERGLGAEACWIAAQGTGKPLFPIGGIDVLNAGDLARVGRAAVGSAILSASDPASAARAIRGALETVES